MLPSLWVGCGARSALDEHDPMIHSESADAASDVAVSDGVFVDAGNDPDAPDAPPVVPCDPRGDRETCNGRDDDCDGRVDEGLPLAALAETVVLREPTEMNAGDCSTCAIAGTPILAPSETGGYFALFSIATSAASPSPNVFRRELSDRGQPLLPIVLVEGAPTTNLRSMRSSERTASGLPIAMCTLAGPSRTPGVLLAMPDGTVQTQMFEAGSDCLSSMSVIGGRVLALPSPASNTTQLSSRSLDGTDLRTTRFEVAVSNARAASSGESYGVLIEQNNAGGGVVRSSQVLFASVDPSGAVRVPPRRLALPGPFIWDPFLFATNEGWLIVVPSRGGPAQRASLNGEGVLQGDPAEFDDAHTLTSPILNWTLESDRTGTILAHVFAQSGRMHVQLLDAQGAALTTFEEAVPDGVGHPNVLFTDDGRLLVTWHGAYNGPNGGDRLYLREFGCGL
ncbi:MAG: hypothetical protein ACI9KE_002843 [Polyangiales bacterium]|jgi:hypothetical protein